MLPSERQKKIVDLLATKDILTISELMTIFDISIETVRRDLTLLEKQGSIQKVYGGAKLKDISFGEPTLENRLMDRLSQKEAIGKKCSEFINDGDCIFIDSGSTTFHIAKQLTNKKNLTIITNSIPVVNELISTDFEIIIIGGRIRHNERSVVTYDYIFNFSELNIQKSFICASGITVENGVSDFNMQEAVTRKIIIERSKEVFVAADSSKFHRDVTINIATLGKIDYIITDSQLSRTIVNNFKKTNTTLILAED
ncbi:DeoR/GlpR family DNA-binding transcription regulator [Sporomusa malonica]|uniref:Transcriptional regulator, DeoR family n=1 Tax=Sporomusa malonica TaxID=112901 RepID=A0A1W2DRC8_9FIRM|nr:DeoR/GlpR family DNA-binding transcription regulator [Sporomusa malonica]SMC99602.1 transcriptional regulator, DeoR family [Sporomusa malonica]